MYSDGISFLGDQIAGIRLTEPFLSRPFHREADLNAHRLDVNPEAALFSATDDGATEAEYLALIASLVGVFKPTHLMETGTWNGDGAACLLQAASAGSHVLSLCHHALSESVRTGLEDVARERGSQIQLAEVNTLDLIHGRSDYIWSELTEGKVTFAFLDSSLPDRAQEFAYLSDPANGVLDFTRPLCFCVHDTSRYRHPHDADTGHLAGTLAAIERLCHERGWQSLRLHQSRGITVLTRYPEAAGIDGTCIVPEELLSDDDRRNHTAGGDPYAPNGDPYLITDYYPVLRDLVRRRWPRRLLEIGTRYGYSLAVMLDAADRVEAAFAVDLPIISDSFGHGGTEGAYAQAQANVGRMHEEGRWPNLTTLRFLGLDSQSVQDLPSEIDRLDLAYIDADHGADGCRHDLALVLPRMNAGGAIVVDDADWCGLRATIEEWAAQRGLPTDYVPDSSGRGRVVITVAGSQGAEMEQGEGMEGDANEERGVGGETESGAMREAERDAQVSETPREAAGTPHAARLTERSLFTREYDCRVVTHDRGGFRDLRGENVLIYFPHGFGDWVHFSHILPLLEPSNRYWMARYGDDNAAVMDGSAYPDGRPCAQPLYLGVKTTHCGDGGLFDNVHFGLDYGAIAGERMRLTLPLSLDGACRREGIGTLLFTSFPESWGGSPFPFHTKARGVLQHLVTGDALQKLDLDSPLRSCVRLDVPGWVLRWVEARLANFTGFGGRRLCLIGRNGYTATGKNWGHLWREGEDGKDLPEGEECRQFMRLMLKKDPRWVFLVMEDRLFEGHDTLRAPDLHCYSYAELFGTPDDPAIPFGHVMRALVRLASLSIGVPAGAHHLCMVRQDLPSVGLWIEHYPSWYDEPKEASVHVLSRNLRDLGLDARPGSFTERGNLRYRVMPVDTRRLYGEQVLAAVEQVLGG